MATKKTNQTDRVIAYHRARVKALLPALYTLLPQDATAPHVLRIQSHGTTVVSVIYTTSDKDLVEVLTTEAFRRGRADKANEVKQVLNIQSV